MPDTSPRQTASPSTLADLLDRERIIDRLTELFLATDRKDWPAVEACFAPQVEFDMSSVGAGPASSKRPSEIAAGWRTGLAGVERTRRRAEFDRQIRAAGARNNRCAHIDVLFGASPPSTAHAPAGH